MNKNSFDICIIGAGVVGLAISEKLSQYFSDIIVVDKENTFGQHISSRNSEVIHSGFYYPKQSLKSLLCKRGNDLLYKFAQKYPRLTGVTGISGLRTSIPDLPKSLVRR